MLTPWWRYLVLFVLASPALAVPDALRELRKAALEANPRLAEARARLRQAEADVMEAGLLPNPVLQIEEEEMPQNFSTGPGLLMTTLNQSLITGGKRRFRVEGARAGLMRAARLYEQEALEVVRDTTKAYYEVLGARRRLAMASKLAVMAARFRDVAKIRVSEGVTRPIERERAVVLAAQVTADIRKAEADLAIARAALATAVARGEVDEAQVTGELNAITALPPIATLQARAVANSPVLAVPVAEHDAATADLQLARAQSVPDVDVGLSMQHQSTPDRPDDLRGFQVSVPLPVFNRGQAARVKAVGAQDLAKARGASARLTLLNRLALAYRTAERAYAQIQLYDAEVLPAARSAVELADEGYSAGKFTYLEALDGQRALIGATQSYIDALVDYQKAHADLEEIVAGEIR